MRKSNLFIFFIIIGVFIPSLLFAAKLQKKQKKNGEDTEVKYEVFFSPGFSLYQDTCGVYLEGGLQTSLNILTSNISFFRKIMTGSSFFYEGFDDEKMSAMHMGLGISAGYYFLLNDFYKMPESMKSVRLVPQAGIGFLYQKAVTKVLKEDNWNESGYGYKLSLGFAADCRLPLAENLRFGLKFMWHRTGAETVLKFMNPALYISWEF